jgi:hypothetical protein
MPSLLFQKVGKEVILANRDALGSQDGVPSHKMKEEVWLAMPKCRLLNSKMKGLVSTRSEKGSVCSLALVFHEWNLQLDICVLSGVHILRLDTLDKLESLLNPSVQVCNSLLVVLERCRLNTRQATDGYLDNLGGVLNLKRERKLVVDELSLGESVVSIEALIFGILLGFAKNVIEGLEALLKGWNNKIVERGRHLGVRKSF